MADRDTLRPEVREAVEVMDARVSHATWQPIRAELLRLAKIEEERWAVVATRNAAIERSEQAEDELAALKADHAVLQDLCEGTVRANLALGHVED